MFEWDEEKNRRNADKHGVRFEFAIKIFDGPVLTYPDETSFEEFREISVGVVGAVTFLLVVDTDRDGRTRIISARRANKLERRRYGEIFG